MKILKCLCLTGMLLGSWCPAPAVASAEQPAVPSATDRSTDTTTETRETEAGQLFTKRKEMLIQHISKAEDRLAAVKACLVAAGDDRALQSCRDQLQSVRHDPAPRTTSSEDGAAPQP